MILMVGGTPFEKGAKQMILWWSEGGNIFLSNQGLELYTLINILLNGYG